MEPRHTYEHFIFSFVRRSVMSIIVPAQGSTEVNFDLGLPGLGNVGDTITVIATPSDGQTYGEAQYAETTVANTPPVVTSILVEEGYQALEDGIYYFLVGQRVAIHVLVSDDDMDVDQGNDQLRLEIGGESPQAVHGWYISEYRNGEFFLE
ncbi:MAG: hypothetical protein RMJ82_15025, partial [Gemmatales bacterium]|nr:hypothetical protein [Gemmatales bacterium]